MPLGVAFLALLHQLAPAFTAPSARTFVTLMTGWALTHRHRYVTELIQAADAVHRGHHSRYHRFFSHAAWTLDGLCSLPAPLLVTAFAPEGDIELAVDDTLCHHRGRATFGVRLHHDPLRSHEVGRSQTSWGHDWVVLFLVVRRPRWAPTKVWALPVGFRLYLNRQGVGPRHRGPRPAPDPAHRTRPELAVELVVKFAGWFPGRALVLSGDSLYGGASVLKRLPGNVDLVSRVSPHAGLYEPAPPPRPYQVGARRKKGERLPGMAAWAADESRPWRELEFDQYGLHSVQRVKEMTGLYYRAGGSRVLKLVLVRDPAGRRKDQMFYATRVDWDARRVLDLYCGRWSVEVSFANAKGLLGLGDPANRLEGAVRRTAPMALVLYSLVVLWVERGGERHVAFPDRPWYRQKREPSFADLLSGLRRASWVGNIGGAGAGRGCPESVVAALREFASRAG